MDAMTEATPLSRLATEARPFPFQLLEDCETGLCMFSAAFLGINDAVHFAMSGVRTTCVDVNAGRLEQMRRIYPEDWTFIECDAWTYAEAARREEVVWDAVCVDPYTGDAMNRSMETLDLWLSLARRVLIAGTDVFPFAPPALWNVRTKYVRRAPDVYWLALERGE
jgi:hypothetical protein